MVNEKIKELSEKYFPEMVETRRHLHRNPELSYHEFNTTELIVNRLKELGYEVKQPMETGCVAILEGKSSKDRVIALRADIDALPILENGDHKKDFLSQNEGVAHCCGHDVHTSNLLGTAHILADLRDQIEGKVVLIFQAGEEKLPGGGRLLCENGILQELGVNEIYGLHTNPNFKPGQVVVRAGAFMARPDEFEIKIKGVGGHAASPHLTVDPIVTAAQVVTMFQTIASRNIDPTEPVVVTIGKITGGTTYNVIPEEVHMMGTLRTFSQETALKARDRMEEIVKGVTAAAGGTYEFSFNEGYPAVMNTGWAVDNIRLNAIRSLGSDAVVEMGKPIMAGEDFAFYLEHFPGSFFFLGSGGEETGSVYSWHHPKYNADEKCMLTGSTLMASLVLNTDNGKNG